MSRFERKAQSQRKHGPLPDSGASKAVSLPIGRPEWKGRGYVKKKAPRQVAPTSSAQTSTIQEHFLPVELQQLVLDVFRDTFPASHDFERLKPLLQEIKDALFQRDFRRAFGTEEYLEGYAVRWSPSRTLGYASLLAWLWKERATEETWFQGLSADEQSTKTPSKVVCFGGGAAELMAFAALLRFLRSDLLDKPASDGCDGTLKGVGTRTPSPLDLHLVDTADWSSVISKLHSGLTTPPTLSKYASAMARARNVPFLAPGSLRPAFTQADLLESTNDDLRSMIGPNPALLTLCFTLNELYAASIPRTTAFLQRLTTTAPAGSLLLVVDSPGSYSEIAVSSTKEGEAEQEKKKYPMQWLMDHVLLQNHADKNTDKDNDEEESDARAKAKWEKIVDEDSRWYRLDEALSYPVSLENMRFQVHLFRRL